MTKPPRPPKDRRSVSEILRIFAETHAEPRITIRQLRDALGRRAYGPLLLAFAALNLMPVPPGVGIIIGLPVVIISAQLAWGIPTPQFPSWLGARSFATADFRRAIDYILPSLKRIERLLRPRLLWLHGPLTARLVGILSLILSLILILPMPTGGNWPPALAISVLSLAYFERDGLVTLTGIAAGIGCMILMWRLIGQFVTLMGSYLAGL